jgi:transposase-like protein
MSKQSRRSFNTEQKVAILRRHLVDKIPVSDLCEEYRLQPSVLYGWQKLLFDNMGAALDTVPAKQAPQRERQLAAKVEHLEARLAKKDSVIAEISAEYVQLKKELGES